MRSFIIIAASVISVAMAFFGALLGAASASTSGMLAPLEDVATLVGVSGAAAAMPMDRAAPRTSKPAHIDSFVKSATYAHAPTRKSAKH